MSTSRVSVTQDQKTTPPSSFPERPLTPPPTGEKQFPKVQRVLALFKQIQTGRYTGRESWAEFQLDGRDYDEIERRLQQDKALSAFVKDKIRYDYNAATHYLFARMPTGIHELFIDGVEDAIRSQLKAIREGSGKEARFAQKVRPARSTVIEFPAENASSGRKSRYEPDASFWHKDARYPGVIIEVAYSQKKKRLHRLAEDYLLDSDANVRIVIGLDIAYGKGESRKATLTMWRTNLLHTPDGDELQAVPEIVDEAFRDDHGNPTSYPGLQFRLSDFANKGLVQKEIGDLDQELAVSTQQLCDILQAAEVNIRGTESLSQDPVPSGVKKRKRSETPPEDLASGDEARFIHLEERAAKRTAENDPDYKTNK